MKISIILPTYNRSYCISGAIQSVINQKIEKDTQIELIIVDDASTDKTEEVVAKYFKENLIYIKNTKNYGGSKSRNIGIDAASGEFISFIDSDVVYFSEKILKQTKKIKEIGDSRCICYCGYRKQINNQKWHNLPKIYTQGQVLSEVLYSNFIDTSSLFLEKRLLLEIGMFDCNLPRFQDWDLAIRLAKKNKFIPVQEVLYESYTYGDAITLNHDARLAALSKIIEKNNEIISSSNELRSRFYYKLLSAMKLAVNGENQKKSIIFDRVGCFEKSVGALMSYIPNNVYRKIYKIFR